MYLIDRSLSRSFASLSLSLSLSVSLSIDQRCSPLSPTRQVRGMLNARINNTHESRRQDSRNESATSQARLDSRNSKIRQRQESRRRQRNRCFTIENKSSLKSLAIFKRARCESDEQRGRNFPRTFERARSQSPASKPYCPPFTQIGMHNNSPCILVMLCGLPCDISQSRPPF